MALEMVQESVPEDYPEISDLLNRYKTLKDANLDLSQRQQDHEEMNEAKRIEFANFQKERQNEILNFNNEIASLQKQLENGEVTAHRLQNEADVAIRSMSDKTLVLGQILMAVDNLLSRCTAKHGLVLKHTETAAHDATAKVTGTEAQKGAAKAMQDLDVIADYISDFKAIADAAAGRS